MSFGSFRGVCKQASALPVCQLFLLREDKNCSLTGLNLGALRVLDFVDVIASILCFCGLIVIAYKTHSKYAAVGRKEMNMLYLFYVLVLVAQVLSVGGWITADSSFGTTVLWASAVHCGLLVAFFWVLLMNGLVGYQLVEDGSPLSLYGIFVPATFIFSGVTYIAIDTGLQISGAFQTNENLVSIPLFILIFIFPILSVTGYLILQVVLVMKHLSQRKPLIYLGIGFLLFILSQVFSFAISDPICNGTKFWIDGKVFSTFLSFAALACVFKFWSCITEDEWEDFEDQF